MPGPKRRSWKVGIGTSLFLIAVGAILKYAVTANVSGVDLNTVGVILMIVGVIGLLVSIFWMTVWADRRRHAVVADRSVVTDPVARERVVERAAWIRIHLEIAAAARGGRGRRGLGGRGARRRGRARVVFVAAAPAARDCCEGEREHHDCHQSLHLSTQACPPRVVVE